MMAIVVVECLLNCVERERKDPRRILTGLLEDKLLVLEERLREPRPYLSLISCELANSLGLNALPLLLLVAYLSLSSSEDGEEEMPGEWSASLLASDGLRMSVNEDLWETVSEAGR